MNKKYIYLDYNAMKDIQNDPKSEFSHCISTYKLSHRVPFSYAHLSDLQKKLSPKIMHLVERDLKFISDLTDGYMIGFYEDDYMIVKQDIRRMFDEVSSFNIQDRLSEEDLSNILNQGIEVYIKSDNQEKLPEIVMSAMNRFNSNPELYKQLMNMLKERRDTSPEIESSPEIELIDRLSIKPLTKENFLESLKIFMQIASVDSEHLIDKMTYGYRMLEFCTEYAETVTRKTSFSNIYNDGDHMKFASRSEYYITADKETKKSAIFYSRFFDPL
ncbi:hypothetical protein MT997_31860 [Paenibacillus sp. OVF10]|nr:hypothetical protein MT997_31860 [Paenibacillus sp. OVF10]